MRLKKRNFVLRKRFKRYKRARKTCFVRRKRFSWYITMRDVDDLVIVSRSARRVELDRADPPHRMAALSGANAVSAHFSRPKATINCNICRTFPIFVE